MTLILLLLLQAIYLPPREALENPALVSEVPRKLQKDYDRVWARFLTGREDAKVTSDIEKLLRKEPRLDAVLTVQAYIDLHQAKPLEAERKLDMVLSRHPGHRVALYYLAELAFARGDFARASGLYGRFLEVEPSRTDLEPKRQKASLLATEDLLHREARARRDGRIEEADDLYRLALQMVPGQTIVASAGSVADIQGHIAVDARPKDEVGQIENLGRWGGQIDDFHEIQSAESVTREQLSATVVRYFPQLAEYPQNSRILIDIESSWAVSDIRAVVGAGLLEPRPNHTFLPAEPVTRGELAVALARLSRLLGVTEIGLLPRYPSDVAPANILYSDIQSVLVLGLMDLDDADNFGISDHLPGEEAVQAVERLFERWRQHAESGR